MGGMVPEDVYELVWVSDPRLSPDGRTVAFVVNGVDREANDYRSAVWTVPADGSAPSRRLTFGPSKDLMPRWSPDGTRLAFVSKRGPNDEDAAQLYVIPVAGGGEAAQLTEGPEEVSEVEWSPDGGRLAFVRRVRRSEYEEPDDRARAPRRFTRLQYKLDSVGWTGDRPRHVFVVDADGSNPPVQLTDGAADDHHPSWSPDGERIAFVSARHEDWDLDSVTDLYLVPAAGGTPEAITAADGGSDAAAPSWSSISSSSRP